ncbi:MAG TPA: F0F1 ATP synthase subunit B [Thermomicrobiaceae bacterium]|nr:F0F1 ATP synthase subunit B [Thermomicrobiaceae bacterium]
MSALGVHWELLIVQLIAFIIFLILLWKFALGPIVRTLDARQDRIRDSIEAADRMERELAATRAQNEEVLAEARREAQQIIAGARENSEQMISRAQEQARVEGEQLIEKARQTIQQEQHQAWLQLRKDVAELAIAAATKIVRHDLDPAQQAQLIEETLQQAGDRQLDA